MRLFVESIVNEEEGNFKMPSMEEIDSGQGMPLFIVLHLQTNLKVYSNMAITGHSQVQKVETCMVQVFIVHLILGIALRM